MPWRRVASGAPKGFSTEEDPPFFLKRPRSRRYVHLHFLPGGATIPLVRRGGGQGVIQRKLSLRARTASRQPGVEGLRGSRRERVREAGSRFVDSTHATRGGSRRRFAAVLAAAAILSAFALGASSASAAFLHSGESIEFGPEGTPGTHFPFDGKANL